MTSNNRPVIFDTELPRIRITRRMSRALKAVAAQQKVPRGRPGVGVSEWVRDTLMSRLDAELPGWDRPGANEAQ